MNNVEIILDHFLWKKKINNPKTYIKKKISKLNKISIFRKKSKNFTIFLTNNRKMKQLNKKFRNKNKPTDVLSFPFNDKNCIYLEENVYNTTDTILTDEFLLSIDYLRSLELVTISFLARDASLSLSLDLSVMKSIN